MTFDLILHIRGRREWLRQPAVVMAQHALPWSGPRIGHVDLPVQFIRHAAVQDQPPKAPPGWKLAHKRDDGYWVWKHDTKGICVTPKGEAPQDWSKK